MNNSLKSKIVTVVVVVIAIATIGNLAYGHRTSSRSGKISHVYVNNKTAIGSLPEPAIVPTTQPSPPVIYASNYIVVDSTTGYPLAEKNADAEVPIASTTKIMTSLIALETLPLDKVITITGPATNTEGSVVDFMPNEKVTVHDLLYAMLLNSANNAAVAIATADGNEQSFVDAMNAKAKTLGLTETEYKDPAGLDDSGHSSARDLAILTMYALQNPTFRQIVDTPTYEIWSVDKQYKHELNNANRLVQPTQPLYLANAIGVKTGFTPAAGHCLVSAADYGNGRRLVSVILNTNSTTADASARESRNLLTWAAKFL